MEFAAFSFVATVVCMLLVMNRNGQLAAGYSNLSRFQRSLTPFMWILNLNCTFGGILTGLVVGVSLYQDDVHLFLSSLAAVGAYVGTTIAATLAYTAIGVLTSRRPPVQ